MKTTVSEFLKSTVQFSLFNFPILLQRPEIKKNSVRFGTEG